MRVDGGGGVAGIVAARRVASELRTDTTREPIDVPAAERRQWNTPQPPFSVVPPQPSSVLKPTTEITSTCPTASIPDTRTLALLAKDVYADKATPPEGWRVADTSDLYRLGLRPDMLENAQSGFRARVYVEGTGSEARHVVTFRGSQQRGDWIANGQQAVGLQSDHYRRALQIGAQLARSDVANVHVAGHSLGGGLASATGLASGRHATTFQAAGLSDATISAAISIRSAEGAAAAPFIRAYNVRGEILSAIQDGGDRVAGGLIGSLGGLGGVIAGASKADAPSAYGQRITLDAVRPEGVHWWQDNPVARHGMDWVLASL